MSTFMSAPTGQQPSDVTVGPKQGAAEGLLAGAQQGQPFDQAKAELKLTPQEQYLYQTHLNNLKNGPVKNPDGSTSTLLQVSFEQDGRTYNVPSVWDGAKHKPQEAVEHARKIGLEKFPSYKSNAEAEARYEQMHRFMERDIRGK